MLNGPRVFLIVLVGLIITAANAAEPPALPEWAARLPGGGTLRIAVPAPEEARFAHLAWPKAVRANDGTIVLAYLAGIFHGTHGGTSPAVSLSSDNGRTFTAPHILREFDPEGEYTASGNLALGVAGDGAMVLLAMGYKGDTANHIFGWRSEDHGRKWSPVDTSALGPNKTGSVTGNIVQVPDVGLVAVGHYRKGSAPDSTGIWMSVSADHGKSWGAPRKISDVKGVEPVLVRAGERLLIFIRDADKNRGRQWLAVSDDQGRTWRTELSRIEAEDPAKQTLAHPFAIVNPAEAGEVLVLTAQRPRPGNFWLWRGSADKLEFKRDRAILQVPAVEKDNHSDYGYPWMVHLEGRKWLVFYYHGLVRGACPIWVAEVEL